MKRLLLFVCLLMGLCSVGCFAVPKESEPSSLKEVPTARSTIAPTLMPTATPTPAATPTPTATPAPTPFSLIWMADTQAYSYHAPELLE